MHPAQAQPNVWPGYVAALSGVAVSILLLIATLGLAIFEATRLHRDLEAVARADAGEVAPPEAGEGASPGGLAAGQRAAGGAALARADG
ncbi:MAG: hypothetical protein REI09_15390, partial [Candidatus Dactylopiibacterium sp.]|nr:hypothetical protein [Candidatus Dactylopiibacterium sp.]